jgi:hypothetical protein
VEAFLFSSSCSLFSPGVVVEKKATRQDSTNMSRIRMNATPHLVDYWPEQSV